MTRELFTLGMAVVVAVLILQDPIVRSARSIGVTVASAIVAIIIGTFGTRWLIDETGSFQPGSFVGGAIAGAVAGGLPLFVAYRWRRVVSALPPADFDEYQAIWNLRKSLNDDDRFRVLAPAARVWLTTAPVPAPEWSIVRQAFLAQINITERILDGEAVTVEEAHAARNHADRVWSAAIDARRRFFR